MASLGHKADTLFHSFLLQIWAYERLNGNPEGAESSRSDLLKNGGGEFHGPQGLTNATERSGFLTTECD
jgi:hypothetical protein